METAWNRALAEAGVPERVRKNSRLGRLSRKRLEVWVSHAVVHQELMFHAHSIVAHLEKLLPDRQIRTLFIRVGNKDHA